MSALASTGSTLLAVGIALTMTAALVLGGIIGWIRSRHTDDDTQYEDGE